MSVHLKIFWTGLSINTSGGGLDDHYGHQNFNKKGGGHQSGHLQGRSECALNTTGTHGRGGKGFLGTSVINTILSSSGHPHRSLIASGRLGHLSIERKNPLDL